MNFEVDPDNPGKVYDILTGLVAPRPIALVTTQSETGWLDAAPFSAYNYLCSDPPLLGIGMMDQPGGFDAKTTRQNIKTGGEFVVNVVTEDLGRQMNICATQFPDDVDKLGAAGLTTTPSARVKVPRIRQAHAALECVLYMTLEVGHGAIVLGRVVSMYVEDRFVDPAGPFVRARDLHALGRMNGQDAYVRTEGAFVSIPRLSHAEWLQGER